MIVLDAEQVLHVRPFLSLGRSYDGAVVSAGFIGFGLGATPTAMANMTAVTQRHAT